MKDGFVGHLVAKYTVYIPAIEVADNSAGDYLTKIL
jgi:hypothetical protein